MDLVVEAGEFRASLKDRLSMERVTFIAHVEYVHLCIYGVSPDTSSPASIGNEH
jgi:hypothetical protein